MPSCPRKDIVRDGEIAVYHTWSRCVQRAFLCGEDAYTGQNFEHRRDWIQSLLKYLASIFAVDVGNYSILANHQHLICRTRPDIAASWSDEEVAWRWKMAWPSWEDGQWVREPTDEEIQELLAKPDHLDAVRANLSRLSWFMARWKEPIARMANLEMDRKGHFYESRFGSRELYGEGPILSCCIYLDVNQQKAGLSSCLVESEHSGIQDRIQARQQQAEASVKKFYQRNDSQTDYQLETSQVELLLADCFLSPIDQQGPLMMPQGASLTLVPDSTAADDLQEQATDDPPTANSVQQHVDSEETNSLAQPHSHGPSSSQGGKRRTSKRDKQPTRKIHRRLLQRRRPRASDNVILSMPFPQYLQIAEWTSEQIRGSGTDPPPPELALLLRTKELDPLRWQEAVENFAAWFGHAVGKASVLSGVLERLGRQWIRGISPCRDVFS